MFEKLFTPIKIRGMELKHRIVMPAMEQSSQDRQVM